MLPPMPGVTLGVTSLFPAPHVRERPRHRPGMGDATAEAKKALQAEVVAVKGRWQSEIKLMKAKQDSPNYPLPLSVARTVPRPDAASMYDVEELTVRLWIDSLEATVDAASAPVRVEVLGPVPDSLQLRIAEHVDARWRMELGYRGASKSWLLEKMLGWVESAYVDLLMLDPSYVECYEGCNDDGMTIRRYAIAEPPPAQPESEEGESEDSDEYEDSDDEDIDTKLSKMSLTEEEERKFRIKMKAEEEADRQWREERRKEAERLGEDFGGPKPVSKKEMKKMQDEKRQTQGKRLRKVCPRLPALHPAHPLTHSQELRAGICTCTCTCPLPGALGRHMHMYMHADLHMRMRMPNCSSRRGRSTTSLTRRRPARRRTRRTA